MDKLEPLQDVQLQPSPSNAARNSSFVELRSSAGNDSVAMLNRKASTETGLRSRGSSGASRATTVYNEADANAMILRANSPPNYTGGFQDIMKQIKAKEYYAHQFTRIQEQTEMGLTLQFSDVEPTFYETNYARVMQDISVFRVRMCFLIGFCSLGVLYGNEYLKHTWDANTAATPDKTNVGRTETDKLTIMILTFGVLLGSLVLGMLLTFTKFGKRYLENLTMIVFMIIAAVMIIKKPIEKSKGPVIPLQVLIIPVFGVTRMRFVKSCVVGWGIFFSYFITMLIARKIVPYPKKFDTTTDISYATINYGFTVIGGMVSQYRQELQRRRNFCLQLPFSGAMDSDALQDLETEKFSQYALMHRLTLKFRHPEVEELFYRYWYLIDAYPYENPNSGALHQGVFRTIRFAIYTIILNQCILLLQDIKFLKIMRDDWVENSDFNWAVVLRFGVVIPLYLLAAAFMYFMGKSFYAKWVKEAEEAQNRALSRATETAVDVQEAIPTLEAHKPQARQEPRMRLVVQAAMIRERTRDRVLNVLLNKGGYVRSTQIFSSFVIGCHVAAYGALLLIVSTSDKVNEGVKVGKPKPVYYMGFLNVVVFAHRSGLKLRSIYAAVTTFFVLLGIIIGAKIVSPDYYKEYAGYAIVIFLLASMTSYEEESLRRTFFVLKSLRTLEFEEWFRVVLRLQGWVRDRMRRRLKDLRARSKKLETEASTKPEREIIKNTGAQMVRASKIGLYALMFNLIIALTDVIGKAIAEKNAH